MVSIQLKLSGHRFSIEGEANNLTPRQTVMVIGSKVTLVPDESLNHFSKERLMELAGYIVSDMETIVTGSKANGITCLIAIPKEARENIESRFGQQVSYTSPLLNSLHGETNCITIDMFGNTMFIHGFNDGLKRAEAFDIENDADIICIVRNTMDGTGLNPDSVVFYSGERKRLKLLRRYFSNVRCE